MKHKVIGLFLVYSLYTSLGLFGICLRADDSTPTTAKPAPAPATAPVAVPGQPQPAGQFGQLPPGQFGAQINGVQGIPGNFGGQIGGPPGGLAGVGKGSIERGPKQVLAAAVPAPVQPPKPELFVSPKVEPGKVKWHADFDTACKAAEKTGKPVFLFQMMGKLDDQFC
jgi:hypothetical protein